MESQENATDASVQPFVHTPGPWQVFEDQGQWKVCDDTFLLRHVAVVTDGVPAGEHEGNARLISKSPELLERLESMIELFEMDSESNTPGTDAYTEITLAKMLVAQVRGEVV